MAGTVGISAMTSVTESDIDKNHTHRPMGSIGEVKDQEAMYNPETGIFSKLDIGSNPSSSNLLASWLWANLYINLFMGKMGIIIKSILKGCNAN